VCLLEDDESVRRSLSLLMDLEGLRVEAYGSAQEFFAGFEPERAGCLVLDVHLPGMSGTAVHESLLQRDIRLPTIFLTGHAPPPLTAENRRQGVVAVFEKPCPPDELIAAVKRALGDDSST